MAKITMKSTKQEIMDAYEAAKSKIEKIESIKDDPLASAKAEKAAEIIKSADAVAENDILNPAVIAQYNDLKAAIQMKKEELQNLYGIEAKANSLVAIINAHKDKEAELKEKLKAEEATLMADMAAQEEALNSDIKELEKKKEDLIAATKAEHDELKKELDKQRKREAEEYNYDLKRARQLEEDKWTDEKNARENELAKREAAVKADEQELAEKTAYIEELEQKVEEIPTLVQEATEEGVKKGKADADKSNAFEVRALKQKNDYDVQILCDKVNRLELEVDSLRDEKVVLQSKLDEAYAQMRDLAAETVKSTGGVKILNGQNSQLNK